MDGAADSRHRRRGKGVSNIKSTSEEFLNKYGENNFAIYSNESNIIRSKNKYEKFTNLFKNCDRGEYASINMLVCDSFIMLGVLMDRDLFFIGITVEQDNGIHVENTRHVMWELLMICASLVEIIENDYSISVEVSDDNVFMRFTSTDRIKISVVSLLHGGTNVSENVIIRLIQDKDQNVFSRT